MSKIIEIIPNVSISYHMPDIEIASNNLVLINTDVDSIGNNILNLEININNLYIYSQNNKLKNMLPFDKMDVFIKESLLNNKNTIIYSDNIIITILVCIDFLVRNLDINFLESLYYICKKMNIKYESLPNNFINYLINNYIISGN